MGCTIHPSNVMPAVTQSAYLYKHTHPSSLVKSASGIWLNLDDGKKILNATGGVAVSAIGHGNGHVKDAIIGQLDEVVYCHPGVYKTECAQNLASFLVNLTHGKMARALLTGSGSLLPLLYEYINILADFLLLGLEVVEAAMKLAQQHFLELSLLQPTQYCFIRRQGSWHGCTIATLSMGDFKCRKTLSHLYSLKISAEYLHAMPTVVFWKARSLISTSLNFPKNWKMRSKQLVQELSVPFLSSLL